GGEVTYPGVAQHNADDTLDVPCEHALGSLPPTACSSPDIYLDYLGSTLAPAPGTLRDTHHLLHIALGGARSFSRHSFRDCDDHTHSSYRDCCFAIPEQPAAPARASPRDTCAWPAVTSHDDKPYR